MTKVLDDIPAAPGALPLVGHLRPLMQDPPGFIAGLPAYGDVVRLRLGPLTFVTACNVEPTLQVLRDDRTFDKGRLLYDRARDVVGDGLITCLHADHRRQRRVLQPAFDPAHLSEYAPVMTANAAEAADQWRDGQVIDVKLMMTQLSERIIAAVMFSDALSPEALQTALEDVGVSIAGVYRLLLSPPPLSWLPTAANRRYHRARARLRATLGEVIAERRVGGAGRGDLFSAMLATADYEDGDGDGDGDGGDGNPLTDAEAVDQALSFFVAGTETTAGALSWALYALGQHPEVADRVRAEADQVLGDRPGTYGDLPKLEFTTHVVTECLRRWPPASWLITRTVTRDTELGGHALLAGTSVAFSPYLIHHRPDLYPEPYRFAPDRWEAANRPSREAFIPFGWGARKCIGEQFGLAETVLVLATLVARWRFEALPGPEIRPSVIAAFALRGLRMRVVEHGR